MAGDSAVLHMPGAGRTADARNLLYQLLRLEEQGKSVTMEVALVYHGLGDHARALDYLEKAAQDRAISLWQLKSSPFWRDLRSNPRAQAILRKMNLVK